MSSRTKTMIASAPHFGTPLRRIQRSGGVAMTAMKTASSSGDRIGAARCSRVMISETAPAMMSPRAGGENWIWIDMDELSVS
jgi:hypothetical protein